MTKNILVTGAEGFIGSHLVEELVKENHKVRALCLYNSFADIGWLQNLDPSIQSNIEVVFGDIRDYDSINNAIKGVDAVFHLAALIAIPYSYIAPRSYIDTNILGTLNLLKASLENNLEQVIHTSSSEVYGTAQEIPITEKHPLVGQSPYAASKIAADQIAHSFFCSYNLPVSIVRPFNTYGPRQSLRAVIPTIINQALSKTDEIKLGKITTTRDFNFVKDTIRGIKAFLGNKNTIGETINLGTNSEVTIKDLVNIVSEISGKKIKIICDADRLRPERSEVDRLRASNKKAEEILSWSPEYSLKQGLEITYDWYKEYSKSKLTQIQESVL